MKCVHIWAGQRRVNALPLWLLFKKASVLKKVLTLKAWSICGRKAKETPILIWCTFLRSPGFSQLFISSVKKPCPQKRKTELPTFLWVLVVHKSCPSAAKVRWDVRYSVPLISQLQDICHFCALSQEDKAGPLYIHPTYSHQHPDTSSMGLGWRKTNRSCALKMRLSPFFFITGCPPLFICPAASPQL